MEEKHNPMPSEAYPSTPTPDAYPPADCPLERLEAMSAAVVVSVEETAPQLQDYYVRLAQEAEQSEKPSDELDQEIREKIDVLKRTSGNLSEALQATNKLEDELSARFFDMRTSRDRKWYLPNPPANGSIDLEEQ